ncbi:MAG: ATP synthase F1 subunit gamma [Clostridia bacterium]|nr:ATP synthase F1 subunit gamma [Clostridia bacterium]
MAGASMNDIKARMKSVESTMQITKAMELVATSKLRRAKENVEKSRPYYEILKEAIKNIKRASDINSSPLAKSENGGKSLFIVIAGDRGLAGGYNSNVFKLAEQLSKNKDSEFLPIGKKATEYMKHRSRVLFSEAFPVVANVGVGDMLEVSREIYEAFSDGKYSEVFLVYTKFVSMMTQLPVYEQLLPLELEDDGTKSDFDPIIEEEPEELLTRVIPGYVGGVLYSTVCEAIASECAARRSAMNAANKNAVEMIDMLMLRFNRARQAVITQEITEIVSGAEAL